MKREPKELTNKDLSQIAFKVRARLETRWGRTAITHLFTGSVGVDFLRETYIAVREQIELEDGR